MIDLQIATSVIPGSCGPRRFNQAITMASVTPSAHSRPMKSVQRIDIDHRPTQKIGVNLKTQIETVMRETARGGTDADDSCKTWVGQRTG